MKANEVRLNNYVIYDNEVYQIDTIAEVFPTLKTDKFGIGVVDWNNIKPIPLTEEWLIKFGFIKINNDFYIKRINNIDGFKLLPTTSNGLHNGMYVMCNYSDHSVIINNVHHLQNLFFAITQKELTL